MTTHTPTTRAAAIADFLATGDTIAEEGDRMKTYPNLAAYTADVEAARTAYASDMAVQNGLCAECKTRKKDGHMRLCWTCRHSGVKSK